VRVVHHKGSEIKRAQALVFLRFEREGKEFGLSEEEVVGFCIRALEIPYKILFSIRQTMVLDSSLHKVHNDAVLDGTRKGFIAMNEALKKEAEAK
jgi:hypothetical protein